MSAMSYLYGAASAVYATLATLIAIQARQAANLVLALCCAVTAVWAATGSIWSPQLLQGPMGFLDLIRVLVWYAYLLYLYRRSEVASSRQIFSFSLIAFSGLVAGVVTLFVPSSIVPVYTIYSWPIATRITVCIFELLLIENLYFNLPDSARWHIALPCILLAGLACFDILVVADTALFRRPSLPLEGGRVIAMVIVAPLLVLAAFRSQRWREPVRLSRAAVFHSATLVLSGSVLLSLALAGEILRHLDDTWGWVAELGLLFCGLIFIMLFASSRSAKSVLDQVVTHHFFADRYDYRSQWLSCIQTLSGRGSIERSDLHTRAIEAVADVVNSPCGILFTFDRHAETMAWARSWNMPSTAHLPVSHPQFQKLMCTGEIIDLTKVDAGFADGEPLARVGPLWLAVPLRHSSNTVGVIILGPARIPFRMDQEVFDLLAILGQEVGTYIAEQQATEAVVQTRSLHDYGKRFAFVAHDIKNVASQLALLLANAEHHLGNPDFQQDMLQTVRASVQKIDRLLKRLDEPSSKRGVSTTCVVARVTVLIETYRRSGRSNITFESDGSAPCAVIGPEAFDTALSHLINNAIDAAPAFGVSIKVYQKAQQAYIEIADQGEGMTQDFIRTELFVPFKTTRTGGSGIGAFQARELVSEAGGEVLVFSEKGVGTTIRLVFALAERLTLAPSDGVERKAVGDSSG